MNGSIRTKSFSLLFLSVKWNSNNVYCKKCSTNKIKLCCQAHLGDANSSQRSCSQFQPIIFLAKDCLSTLWGLCEHKHRPKTKRRKSIPGLFIVNGDLHICFLSSNRWSYLQCTDNHSEDLYTLPFHLSSFFFLLM